MKIFIFLLLTCTTVPATSAAEFYEWVDEKGVKQYTQQPPPPSAKQVQQRRFGSNVIETSGASYSSREAAKNFPVTLYATDCDPCKLARAHLVKRGIPYSEKNPSSEVDKESLKQLTDGGMEVPLLIVGRLKTLKGYSAAEWDSLLTQAGYPNASR
jgi:hypothetical protein